MIGFFGGTFDPFHKGHLHAAQAALQRLELNAVHLVLSANPPLRGEPHCSIEHRLAMLHLGVSRQPGLLVDEREVRRLPETSYTLQTLIDIRAEMLQRAEAEGKPLESICWLLGLDQFQRLDSWKCWQRLTDYAHLVVLQRPASKQRLSPSLRNFVARHLSENIAELKQTPSGRLYIMPFDMLQVSATEIRRRLAAGESVADLLPCPVNAYIKHNRLYQSGGTAAQPT